MAHQKPDWNILGRNWPNHEASRFVVAGGFRWHVQVMGTGPALLLIHGTGAATHSWRDVAPLLAQRFTVIAPDLPGHGFTDTPDANGLSLPGMSQSLCALLETLDTAPVLAVGHSAGAAIAVRMATGGRFERGVVSLNGALQPFPGAAGHIFPQMAKAIFLNPVAQQMFVWRASRPGAVGRLLAGTGSSIDRNGLRCYEALMETPGHIAGVLGMMAGWDLQPLQADIRSFASPLTLVTASNDLAIPPRVAEEVHRRVGHSRLIRLPGLGHLAHEEAPGPLAAIIEAAANGTAPTD